MTVAAAKTGVGPTMAVALDQHFPADRRIVDDDLAVRILPPGMRAFVWLARPAPVSAWLERFFESRAPGIWGGVLCRKRYIDEKLIESVGRIGAVVNLGAGYDTRAYRLPALAGVPVWEVDQPENIEPKRARLRKLLGEVPARVTLVSIDFDHEALGAVLAANGYVADQPAFFIWEAVTQYLTDAGVEKTLDFLAHAAGGSRLAFTYIRQDFLDGQRLYGQQATYAKYVVKDKTWRYGIAPEGVADLLSRHGWRVVEHLGYDELAERYVKPTGRALAATPIERMVYAEKV